MQVLLGRASTCRTTSRPPSPAVRKSLHDADCRSAGDNLLIIQQVPQVSFKTQLSLAVLPRISASGTVILEVDVDNGSRGTVQPNGNISINTQRVQTTVLVKDPHDRHRRHLRDRSRRSQGSDARPVAGAVHRQLLQAQLQKSNEGELLVFITPRILKNAEAVAARPIQ